MGHGYGAAPVACWQPSQSPTIIDLRAVMGGSTRSLTRCLQIRGWPIYYGESLAGSDKYGNARWKRVFSWPTPTPKWYDRQVGYEKNSFLAWKVSSTGSKACVGDTATLHAEPPTTGVQPV